MRYLILAPALVVALAQTTRAQDSTASRRPILIEARVGTTEMLGDPGRTLIGPDAAIGVTVAVEGSRRVGAWFSTDYRPSNSSVLYNGPTLSPAVSIHALTAGVYRALGLSIGRARMRPIELGLGVGATRMTAEWRGNTVTEPPAGAQVDNPWSAGLLSSRRWGPTATARLRIALPLGRIARLSATGALAATRVGDVRLWNGQWEPSGDGTRYRASSETWRYGTIVAVPLTLGVGAAF
jgi:hypothetical protein